MALGFLSRTLISRKWLYIHIHNIGMGCIHCLVELEFLHSSGRQEAPVPLLPCNLLVALYGTLCPLEALVALVALDGRLLNMAFVSSSFSK